VTFLFFFFFFFFLNPGLLCSTEVTLHIPRWLSKIRFPALYCIHTPASVLAGGPALEVPRSTVCQSLTPYISALHVRLQSRRRQLWGLKFSVGLGLVRLRSCPFPRFANASFLVVHPLPRFLPPHPLLVLPRLPSSIIPPSSVQISLNAEGIS
jgi:hypothetical protein